MRPIKIVHIAETTGWAGGERYLLNLARGLPKRAFQFEVILPQRGVLASRLAREGIPCHLWPTSGILGDPQDIATLAQCLRKIAPHIVQSHGARTNVYARIACRLANLSTHIATVHNSLFDYPISPLRRKLYLTCERMTQPLSRKILAVSHAIADDLVEKYRFPKEKIVVIHNGIAPDEVRPRRPAEEIRKGLGIPQGATVIGTVGRLNHQKNPHLLFEAFRELAPRFLNLHLLFIGDGELLGELERLVKQASLQDRCHFAGARIDDVYDYFNALDLFVLTSRSEGLPFVVLEAMALAKPIVATRVNGVPEAVRHEQEALLIPPCDLSSLVAALTRLLEHPSLARRLAHSARQRVCEHFTLDKMVSRHEELYRRCVVSPAL